MNGNDDPILTSKPGDTSLKGVTTEGGWQYSRSEWMEMLKEAHALLQQDNNNQDARQVIAEFNTAFRDTAQDQTPHPLAGTGEALKSIVDWFTQDAPEAVGGLMTPPGAAKAIGQATGIGNIGNIIDFSPKPDKPTWGYSAGMPGYGSPMSGPVTTPEFRDASIAEKLAMIVQATPANIGYQPIRKLWEGTGALDVIHGGELPEDRQGTYETTKDVLNAALLAATPEIGRVPGAVVSGAKAVARAPGAIARGVKSVGQRAKALYDMPVTLRDKMRATTAVDQARVATEQSRAAYNQARTEAVNIKNQGGTPAQQAKANLQVIQAKLKVQQAEAQLKAQEQAFAQATRKGEIIEQNIERGPAQTEGVELSNTLKRLKIEAMQGKRGGGPEPIGDDLGGLLDDLPPQEPPPAPRPKNPKPKPIPPRPEPTKMPATEKPAATTTSVEVPAKSPAAKVVPRVKNEAAAEARRLKRIEKQEAKSAAKPKITPKGQTPTITESQLVSEVEKIHPVSARKVPSRTYQRALDEDAQRAEKGPKYPFAPEGAEPKTPPPDVTPALEQIVQEVQKGPTRSVEPPATKSGNFEHPPFDESLNIAQKKKWPNEPAEAIESYLDQILKNLEYAGEAPKPPPAPVVNEARAARIAKAEAAARPQPKVTPKESPMEKAIRLKEEKILAEENVRLKAEAEKAKQRKAAKGKNT